MTTKMKICVSLMFCLTVNGASLFAQKIATWKGGTPGRETQWQFPGNWTENQVPNEFSDVLIPDISSSGKVDYPIVDDAVEINALRLEGDATITIASEGRLTVFTDIYVAHVENLKGNGLLKVLNGREQDSTDSARTPWRY